jgi:hypothetical protein
LTDEQSAQQNTPDISVVTDGLKHIAAGLTSFKNEVGKAVDALYTAVENVIKDVTDDGGTTTPPTKPTPPDNGLPSWLPARPVANGRCTVRDGDLHCDVQTGHPQVESDTRDHWLFDQRGDANGKPANKWVRWADWVA